MKFTADLDLDLASTSELIGWHNQLHGLLGLKTLPLRAWSKSKQCLFDIILELERQNKTRIEDEALATIARIEATKNPANANTIRDASLALLCRVSYYEDKTKKSSPLNRVDPSNPLARSVGLPYNYIVEAVRTQFPGAKTSLACLRWYCVKVRVNEHGFTGYQLPQRRPRAGQN